jgi:hypothetical protein
LYHKPFSQWSRAPHVGQERCIAAGGRTCSLFGVCRLVTLFVAYDAQGLRRAAALDESAAAVKIVKISVNRSCQHADVRSDAGE